MLMGRFLQQEDGFVLVVSLQVMVILTIIALSARSTTTIELKVAGNERIYVSNFYLAEAACMDQAQQIEEQQSFDELVNGENNSGAPAWLFQLSDLGDDMNEPTDIPDESNWEDGSGNTAVGDFVFNGENARQLTVSRGVEPGDSLDMDGKRVYTFNIYCDATKSNGRVVVGIGYKTIFF